MRTKVNFENEIWHQIKCDACNDILEDEDGNNLMPDELSIENMAIDNDWEKGQEGTHLCPNCAEWNDTYLD